MAIERVGVPCKRTAVFLFFLFLVVVAASSPSQGQVAPRWELFGGYSYLRLDSHTFGFANNANLNGFSGDVSFNFTTHWGLALDGDGHYGSSLTAYNYFFGPQYSYRRDKAKVFVHVLFGKAQNTVNIETATRNGFLSVGRAIAAGGGYDWNLTPRFTLRVVQADYLNTNTFGTTQNDIRISTGLVFHIGSIGRRPKL